MFLLVHELVGNLDLKKQSRGIDLIRRARFFVLARLQEIRTVVGTIQGDFALFTAALGANAPVNGGAKPFLLTDFANGATQSRTPASIMSSREGDLRLLIADCRFSNRNRRQEVHLVLI
jgi:hypothetical protein